VGKIGSLYGVIFRTLSRESRRKPPESLETYEAFLRFHHHVTLLTPQTFAQALEALEQAVGGSRNPVSPGVTCHSSMGKAILSNWHPWQSLWSSPWPPPGKGRLWNRTTR
jgi:hypothetical protein